MCLFKKLFKFPRNILYKYLYISKGAKILFFDDICKVVVFLSILAGKIKKLFKFISLNFL